MKTKFNDKLFKRKIAKETMNILTGGLVAASGSTCTTITGGGCDQRTMSYDDCGNVTYDSGDIDNCE